MDSAENCDCLLQVQQRSKQSSKFDMALTAAENLHDLLVNDGKFFKSLFQLTSMGDSVASVESLMKLPTNRDTVVLKLDLEVRSAAEQESSHCSAA